jgi:hypothetical protein
MAIMGIIINKIQYKDIVYFEGIKGGKKTYKQTLTELIREMKINIPLFNICLN